MYNRDITNNEQRKNKMTKNEAKLEIFKIDRRVEKLIEQHKYELGEHNKSCIVDEMCSLWREKGKLEIIING